MKRVLAALVVAFVVLTASTAFAAWGPGTFGGGTSTSRSLGVPTSITANGTSTSSVNVSWAAPDAPSVAPTQYVVRRTAPVAATVCTVSATTFACADTGLDSGTDYSYTVEARVGTNWRAVSAEFTASTLPQPAFLVAAPPGPQTAGSAFALVVTATTNGSTVDTAYTGVKTLSYSGPGNAPTGATPTYATSVTFVSGVGTAWTTLVLAQTVDLQVTDGTRTGATNVTVQAGAAARLAYTSSTPVCASAVDVGNGGSFTSRVSVRDAYGNAVVAATPLAISLSKSPAATGTLVPVTLTIPTGASESTAAFTFTLPVGNPPDTTVTASSGALTPVQCTVRKNDH
jgi:hypothetical protein